MGYKKRMTVTVIGSSSVVVQNEPEDFRVDQIIPQVSTGFHQWYSRKTIVVLTGDCSTDKKEK